MVCSDENSDQWCLEPEICNWLKKAVSAEKMIALSEIFLTFSICIEFPVQDVGSQLSAKCSCILVLAPVKLNLCFAMVFWAASLRSFPSPTAGKITATIVLADNKMRIWKKMYSESSMGCTSMGE